MMMDEVNISMPGIRLSCEGLMIPYQSTPSVMFSDTTCLDGFQRSATSMGENSSVDLLEYVAKLLLYDDIIRHITLVSFGSMKDDNEKFVRILKDVLPDFEVCINSAGKDNLGNSNLKMVHKIVNQHQPELMSISKLHRSDEKRLSFEAAFLLLFSKREEADDYKIRTISAFLQKYPEFKDDAMIEAAEQEKLLKFRNMMKLAQLFIPAKNHKEHLMDLVTRLVEGREQKYVTGSGEKPATRRRVLIYEREGEIRPVPRPPRLNPHGIINNTPNLNINFHVKVSSNSVIIGKGVDERKISLCSDCSLAPDAGQVIGKKRKERNQVDSVEGESSSNDGTNSSTAEGTKSIVNILLPPISSLTVQSIPLAPKLHIHGRIKLQIEPQSHPSSEIFLSESLQLRHEPNQRYKTKTPQARSLSSLLDQHKDANFIEDNLTMIEN